MKVVLPAHNEPLVIDGGLINPIWYEFFNNLMKRGVLDMSDVNNSTPITNGQVLVFNGTTKKLTPGAN